MMEGKHSLSGAMNEALLTIFQQAYRDLDLFPLIEPKDIESFRVDYGREVLVRLRQEVNASTKAQKFVFAGHRGCGKSTLLKRFAIEMQPQHFVVFFSIADLIEPSAVTHRNILYAIALQLLSAATLQQIPIAEDIKESLLGWMTTTHKQKEEKTTKSEIGLGVNQLLQVVTLKFQQEQAFRDEIERVYEKRVADLVGKADRIAAAIQTTTQKPVLVVIDDLDKLDLDLVESLYLNNIKVLFSPGFRIVFTIPISATQEPKVMGALTSEGIVRPSLFPVSKFYAKPECRNLQAEPIAKTVQPIAKDRSCHDAHDRLCQCRNRPDRPLARNICRCDIGLRRNRSVLLPRRRGGTIGGTAGNGLGTLARLGADPVRCCICDH